MCLAAESMLKNNPLFYRINLYEAVDFLITLGVTNAINLDGGGSSTFVANSTVINYPSDENSDNPGLVILFWIVMLPFSSRDIF